MQPFTVLGISMTPLIWTLLALGLIAGGTTGGYFAGRKAGGENTSAAQAAQAAQAAADAATGTAEALAANTAALTELTAAAGRPVVLDAETRASLAADVPAGCLDPAASVTPACLVAQCWRFGQSAAQRPEGCGDLLKDARLQSWIAVCGRDAEGRPDWDCVTTAQEKARR
jgi:hypothetical protein